MNLQGAIETAHRSGIGARPGDERHAEQNLEVRRLSPSRRFVQLCPLGYNIADASLLLLSLYHFQWHR